MKKVICAVLAIVLALTLVACGKPDFEEVAKESIDYATEDFVNTGAFSRVYTYDESENTIVVDIYSECDSEVWGLLITYNKATFHGYENNINIASHLMCLKMNEAGIEDCTCITRLWTSDNCEMIESTNGEITYTILSYFY